MLFDSKRIRALLDEIDAGVDDARLLLLLRQVKTEVNTLLYAGRADTHEKHLAEESIDCECELCVMNRALPGNLSGDGMVDMILAFGPIYGMPNVDLAEVLSESLTQVNSAINSDPANAATSGATRRLN